MVNIYDVFRYNQRIQFVFDMVGIDRTGEEFVIEGDSIDKQRDNDERGIVKSDCETPLSKERKGC